MGQRAVIKLNAIIGKNASETFKLIQQVYGESCLMFSGGINVFWKAGTILKMMNILEDHLHHGHLMSFKKCRPLLKKIVVRH